MKNLKKKGFTIVELVIVIAVVAVLAAVLIPTFVNLTKKANAANDTVVAKNMNTALATYSAENGKPESFDEVILAIEEAGYLLANLNAKAEGNVYGWDSKNNQIVYIDAEGKVLYQNTDFEKDDIQIIVVGDVALPGGFTAAIDITKPTTSKALISALESGISVTLTNDISLEKTITILPEIEVVLDLGNKTITYDVVVGTDGDGSSKTDYAILNKGNLTIKNGTIKSRGIKNIDNGTLNVISSTIVATDRGGGMALNIQGGNANIENSTIIAENGDFSNDSIDSYYDPQCLQIKNGAKVTVKDTTLKAEKSGAYTIANENGQLELTNCTVTGYRGCVSIPVNAPQNSTVVINGGKFTQINKNSSGHVFFAAAGKIEVKNADISAAKSSSYGNVYISN